MGIFLILSTAIVIVAGNQDNDLGGGTMSSIILEARDVRYRYPRGMEAICGISFHIRKKEKIALVGPNGAGKSTLLKMFNGMIRPDSGMMLFDNHPIGYDTCIVADAAQTRGFCPAEPGPPDYCTDGVPGCGIRADQSRISGTGSKKSCNAGASGMWDWKGLNADHPYQTFRG